MEERQGYGEAIPELGPLDSHTEQTISDMVTAFAAMTEAEVLKDFERYDFRDVHGHPLTHVIDFMALVRLAKR